MTQTFGGFLKQLRKRSGMTQQDLAAATGYSRSLIGALERNNRLPDVEVVAHSFLPALGLQNESRLATQLVILAAQARGERPPSLLPFTRKHQAVGATKTEEDTFHFPQPPTALVGRDRAVNHLCNRLLRHQGRLLSLIGPPGVGKTRLALAVGADLQQIYKDSAHFVSLAAINDPALLASSVITALKIPDSAKPPQTRLIEHLRHKEMLLILDNFEQIIDSAPLVGELLVECAELRILVTSRERLHLRAEQQFKVPSLDLEDAVDLFVQRAQAVEPDFALTNDNETVIGKLCRRLDNLPLAIELLAARIDVYSPQVLLHQLQDQSLDLLVDGARDLPPQHRTLRNAIGRSYALLTNAERSLLRSLGVFVGGFDLEAIGVVSAWEQTEPHARLATLHALISKNLVRTETLPTGEQRFLLLETIREFAMEQAQAQGDDMLLRQRHYDAYLQHFRTGDSHLRIAGAVTWLAHLELELDNLRAALQWAFDEARYADAAWLMVAANWFWDHNAHHAEAGQWLTRLLPHRQSLDTDLHLAILIILHTSNHVVEGFQPVSHYTSELVALREKTSDKLLQAAAWIAVTGYAADFTQAVATWEQALALARSASERPKLRPELGSLNDHDFGLGTALWAFALILIEHGDFERAVPLVTESYRLLQAKGNRPERAQCLGVLGMLALYQGELAQAHELLQEAVSVAAAVNSRRLQVRWLAPLGIVTLHRGNVAEARRLLNEGLQCCLETKTKVFLLMRNYIYLAELALWEEELAQAAHWLTQGLTYHSKLRSLPPIHAIDWLWIAARLATAQQHYLHAATLFGLADQIDSKINYAIAGPIRALADQAQAAVKSAIGPRAFAKAFTDGQVLSLEEAFATGVIQT